MKRLALALSLILLTGCISSATKDHIDTQIAVHKGYERLINDTLSGNLRGAQVKDNITQEDLSKTPDTVYKLLQRCLIAIHKNRISWHVIQYTIDDGPDPSTLDLGKPIFLPKREQK